MPDVAVVTAASRGIGAACARALKARGYRLAIMSRSESITRIANELGAVAVVGSVTDGASLKQLVQSTLDAYGRIDTVVSNTGHPAKGAILDISDDDWHDGLDVLLLNVVRMCRLVTPIMQEQGGGAFVNISAFGAVEPSLAYPVSSVLRAGLSSYTRLFARAYASYDIRMNSILPGFIDSYPADAATLASIPMGRPGTVGEVAKLVAFLASADAGYVTGQSIVLDGGMTGAR
jgi:NAD(P)-dependent dehydrogenase (short-subunit alcohol dehydrogenase family)